MVCATFTSSTLVSLALFSPRAALNRAECLCALLLLFVVALKAFPLCCVLLCGRDSGNKKEEKVEKKRSLFGREKKTNHQRTTTTTQRERKEGIIDRDRSIDRSIIAR